MAVFHFDIRPVKRSTGEKATAAAAYRAGEKIKDERTGESYDHSRRKDVRHTEIFLPSQFKESPMEWARDRASLWNTAEATEKRKNSRVAREYQVTLPAELSPEQRLVLARSFSREIADRYGVAVDLAIHDPKPGHRGSQNFHAHVLATTRELTPVGLGAKTGLDMGSVQRAKQGLPDHSEEYTAIRERWATLTNEALRDANLDVRVDHRSLAAQGIDRKPLVHVPLEFYRPERNGMTPEAMERLREDYRARVGARLERAEQERLAKQEVSQSKQEVAQSESKEAVDPRNVEEIRLRAVQKWLSMRPKETENAAPKQKEDAVDERSVQPGIEDDHTR